MASNKTEDRPSNLPSHKVFHVRERAGQKGFWQEIGVAFTNRDGSFSLKLNYLPLDFTKDTVSLQVRAYEARDDSRSDEAAAA